MTFDSDTYIVAIEEVALKFRDDLVEDHNTFLNLEEFADWHELDGVRLRASVRRVLEPMSTRITDERPSLHTARLHIQFRAREFLRHEERLPYEGQRLLFDGRYYKVESIENEFGIVNASIVSYKGVRAD